LYNPVNYLIIYINIGAKMVKKNSKLKYILLILFLILGIYISVFFILFYPFHELTYQEIIEFFNTLFLISLMIVSSSYTYKPLITLVGSIILSIITLCVITTIVNITTDLFRFLVFAMFLIMFIGWILIVMHDFKKSNIQLK